MTIEERHPEHVGGGGPEQDYLSRYLATNKKDDLPSLETIVDNRGGVG